MRHPFPDLLATRNGRFAAFFLLYVTEGIPQGFTATALAAQMRRQGVSAQQIGLFVASLYLPWAWKWTVAPLVDLVHVRRFGHRRFWILLCQLAMIATLLLSMSVDFATQLQLFTAIILVHNCFGATQDVAIDGLACDVLSERERGLANGVMFSGAYLGNAIGGAGVLFLTAYCAFSTTFLFVVGCLGLVTLLVVLPLREPQSSATPTTAAGNPTTIRQQLATYFGAARHAFWPPRSATDAVRSRGALLGVVFALLPAGAYALGLALQSNLAVELGHNDHEIALLALFSTFNSALGCVLGGLLSDAWGRRRMLAIYVAATALPTLWLASVMWQHGWIASIDPTAGKTPEVPPVLITAFWSATLVYSVFQGLMYGTRTALFMDLCQPKVAATQFTIYMALLNLTISYSASWQGWAIDRWGYPTTLTVDACLGLLSLMVLPFLARAADDSGR
jgi:PAT family beta-lactamase induction signal transducer AmpG